MQPQLENPPRVRYIILIALSVLAIGAVFYHFVEGWSWLNAVWFCVVTLATVGYGDLTPSTDVGKIFTMFYIIIGIGIFAASINYVIRRGAMNRMHKHHAKHPEKYKN
jgi:hypothetical protein